MVYDEMKKFIPYYMPFFVLLHILKSLFVIKPFQKYKILISDHLI